ncbi:MAG: MBL fold metallo-hydrolase [Propionibacteriaceae bacterium]|nr:MBL fold metallo-hydrolase [Propionibacteriaceae bacterium]
MSIERVVTAAPGAPDFENNAWIVGNDREVIVIDPAHQPDRVALAVGERQVLAVLLTHGHWDHVTAAPAFAALMSGPPVYLNPADEFLWRETHPEEEFQPLGDGQQFRVADLTLTAVATPGHTPGSTCFTTPGTAFTGDTLFEGGPGATRWAYSDFPTIIESIEGRLLTLPDATVVHTGHGPDTTIGTERPHLAEWIARGW